MAGVAPAVVGAADWAKAVVAARRERARRRRMEIVN